MRSVLLTLALAGLVTSSPGPIRRQSITALSQSEINGFTPYTWYASTGYCHPSATLSWNCGTNCDNNPNFKPIASGGNGDSVQYWYVGYDAGTLGEIIVVHQGTDTSKLVADLTDADFFLNKLNSNSELFPGISSSIEVHNGFMAEQALTADAVLAAVRQGMSQYGATAVTIVGHSSGGALSLLDSVYLPLHLPSGTTFKTITYGMPRVGNQAFADYVDANLHLTHINNKEDPIPILPGRFLGFVHPAGEVHIEDTGEWANCPGQDNPSMQCIVGDVPNIFEGNLSDHDGPYNGVEMGCYSNH